MKKSNATYHTKAVKDFDRLFGCTAPSLGPQLSPRLRLTCVAVNVLNYVSVPSGAEQLAQHCRE